MPAKVFISEPIAIVSPSDGQIRVIRNDAKPTLTLVVRAGKAHFALELGPAAWNALNQATSFPPSLHAAAMAAPLVRPNQFAKPAGPARKRGSASIGVMFWLGVTGLGVALFAWDWRAGVAFMSLLGIGLSFADERLKKEARLRARQQEVQERLNAVMADLDRELREQAAKKNIDPKGGA